MNQASDSNYQICTRCIMDTSDPNIWFDDVGHCDHCRRYDEKSLSDLYLDVKGQEELGAAVEKIKKDGKNKDFDCILGLSGGADSSMAAYIAKSLGLRPLAVHMDNGWDSELAVSNIEKIVKKLDFDLLTWVLDWEEFRDLQLSFLKASVINSEVLTDHAIRAALYHTAEKEGVRYIISGENIATEAILPPSWGYDARDWRHIKGIHRRFGTQKLKSFPHLTLFHWGYYFLIRGLKLLPVLSYSKYDRAAVKKLLTEELGWRDHAGKHYDSIYTRFFQGYILPNKFNIDKRRAHLSTMICSGQITREESLAEMENDPYPPDLLAEDKVFVIKKLGLSEEGFEEIMARPPRPFTDYPNNYALIKKLRFVSNLAKRRARIKA